MLPDKGSSHSKKAVVIGAGPAGLAAAYALRDCGAEVTVLEKDTVVGGLCRTLSYEGCRFDIGPHRFFTKQEPVFRWWKEMLGENFLRLKRHTRICYEGKFFAYPLSFGDTLSQLGVSGCLPAFFSYAQARLRPAHDDQTFEGWVRNRFGDRLYRMFFQSYTEKIWGVPCSRISADWAAQRIKGLSLRVAIHDALSGGNNGSARTLAREFYYPRRGAGMMYETAAERLLQRGVRIIFGSEVVGLRHDRGRITAAVCRDGGGGGLREFEGTDFFSSMPIDRLVRGMDPSPGRGVADACGALRYRSLVVAYLILAQRQVCPDHWIYIPSAGLRLGRIQNFKNWSPEMVDDPEKTTLGAEYFCDEGDDLWVCPDDAMLKRAAQELEMLRLIRQRDIMGGFVVRVPCAYPVYAVGYTEPLSVVRGYVDGFPNLRCVGRSGMFRYNNMDHSILTGFLAGRSIAAGSPAAGHPRPWDVNMEKEYHEEGLLR